MKQTKEAAPQPVMLPPELGIEQVALLQQQLAEQIERPETVVFNARDVQRTHTAALQLFCFFCRDRRSSGRNVQWQEPSPALRSAAALLGMTTLLQLAGETP